MRTKTIKYSKKWFNPLFFIIEDIINNQEKVKRVLIYGGKSSGKTLSICQLVAKKGLETGSSAILLRKETARIKTTLKKSFELAIKTTRLRQGWTKLDRAFRSLSGSEVILTGIDNEDKAKGVEGYDFVLMDELDSFFKNDYEQINLSLRGEGRKVIFATWNPVSKNSWVKKELVDNYEWIRTNYKLPNANSSVKMSSCETTILIKTNYKDNYFTSGSPCGTYGFIDENLIADYEALKKTNPNSYRVNVLGLWGNINRGGEFYKSFDINRNVGTHKYNYELPLHISFDENVNPYLSLSIYQGTGKTVTKINEICLEHPFNTLRHTLDKFIKTYPEKTHKIYIYGDRTSLKADSKLEKGQNFFSIIEKRLIDLGYKTEIRLPNKNPSVQLRGNFINDIFAGNIEDVSYSIDEDCLKTIDDYEFVKEAPDGTKHKNKIKHPVTKVTYEEYGHLSDTDDYFLCEYFKEEFLKYSGITTRPRKSKHLQLR